MASHATGWIHNGFMMCWRNIRLQPDFLCHVLVRRRFLFVRLFPALQIPNFKTPAIADKSDLIFQSDPLAQVIWQYQTTLPVRACVLSARVQLSQENAAITRGNLIVRFCGGAHFCKLNQRHDEEKLVSRLR